MTYRVRLDRPVVTGRRVIFAWAVTPATPLYVRTSFSIEFPANIPVERLPGRFWQDVALLCLHTHWIALRPCVVELPFGRDLHEQEFWRRLLEVECRAIDVHRGEPAATPDIELRFDGQTPPPYEALPDGIRAATSFSSGKNSLAQLGLLTDLSPRPLAVTVTDPMPDTADHTTARRRRVLARLPVVADVELIEVNSDLRSTWDNWYTRRELGYTVNVNEMTDCNLYLAATLACAVALGITHVFQAHENEQIDAVLRDGVVVAHPVIGASELVLQALGMLFWPLGLTYSSLISPLLDHHCPELLWRRYASLAPLQMSCWQMQGDAAACNACPKCLSVAMLVLANGGHPRQIEMDLHAVLEYMPKWAPFPPPRADWLPQSRTLWRYNGRIVSAMCAVNELRLARAIAKQSPGALVAARTWKNIRRYREVRRRWATYEPPTGSWSRPFLAWVDPVFRDQLAAVFERELGAGDPDSEAFTLLDGTLRDIGAPIAARNSLT